MTKKIKQRIMFYLALYISIAILLHFTQNKLIYFPAPPVAHNNKSIIIENEGFLIDVIALNSTTPTDKAIIYFGGNAESVAFSANDFKKEFKNHAVYLVNYRGYGKSTGHPSEKANYSDALKIYDEFENKHENIIVIGRSLGSGVATYLASKRDISKLVLVTPFDSIERVAQSKFIIFPMSILLDQKYLSINRVKDIKAKSLVLIAENDEIIPFKNSQKLVNKFPSGQIDTVIIKNSNHNTISDSDSYFESIRGFIS